MDKLTSIVNNFNSISLSQMDEVKLMKRTDTKYAFHFSKLPLLLSKLQHHYLILEIKKNRMQSYRSLYFDTVERKFYLDHHNQRVNRNKIRFREYIESKLVFMEIKTKNNKGRTTKKRIKVSTIPTSLNEIHHNFIHEIIGEELDVQAQQWINFNRLTFVNILKNERLTIDVNLNFSQNNHSVEMSDIVIAELKQERMSRRSEFIRISKDLGIHPMRLSKYCYSSTQLNPNLKKNRFKKKLLYINKLVA